MKTPRSPKCFDFYWDNFAEVWQAILKKHCLFECKNRRDLFSPTKLHSNSSNKKTEIPPLPLLSWCSCGARLCKLRGVQSFPTAQDSGSPEGGSRWEGFLPAHKLFPPVWSPARWPKQEGHLARTVLLVFKVNPHSWANLFSKREQMHWQSPSMPVVWTGAGWSK